MAADLPLRDVHLPPPPSWWPPAPAWWLVFGGVLLVALVIGTWLWLRRRRRLRWEALFDHQVAAAGSGPARLAAASELLRRAARRVDADAVQLQGEVWLRFLDGRKLHDFSAGEGRILLEGGYRPQADEADVQRAVQLARARFLELMAGAR